MPIKFLSFKSINLYHENSEFVTYNKKVMIFENIKQFRQSDRIVQCNSIINFEIL